MRILIACVNAAKEGDVRTMFIDHPSLIGILNGIDYDQSDLSRDRYLPVPYDASHLEEKDAVSALLKTLRRALSAYHDWQIWQRVGAGGMRQDFSWDAAPGHIRRLTNARQWMEGRDGKRSARRTRERVRWHPTN